MSGPRPVILDCDPGIDDAMAIALLMARADVELVAVTTVAGNVPLATTTDNALRLTEFYGVASIPVHAGAAAPLVRPAVLARHVHGADGLGGAPVPAARRTVDGGFAPDVIIETLRDRPGEIDLVAVGPMTNLALALRSEPRVAEWARSVVLMGGAYTRGNITPAAEFNFYADPEAAAAVFEAPWRPVLVSLDLTLQARVTDEVMALWSGFGRLSDQLLTPALGNYFDSRSLTSDDDGRRDPTVTSTAPAIHDACAAAYAVDPGILETVPALTAIETQGALTSGMSVIDFRGPSTNSQVATRIDLAAFWTMMGTAFETIATRMAGPAAPGSGPPPD